ncbi:MAG: phosphonate C-P lyase system protein PhnH [Burkholderiales bacterium]
MKLADIAPGFASPVAAAQQTFRAVLQAMARPGSLQVLPPSATQGLQAPGISVALNAVLLTLLDADTSSHLGPFWHRDALQDYLRFHTNARLVEGAEQAHQAEFVAITSANAFAHWWSVLNMGDDETPQRSTTLILEVQSLSQKAGEPGGLLLRGPGIQDTQRLLVADVPLDFWQERIEAQALFPRGIDLILCCDQTVAAIPRSTHLRLD